MKAIRRCFVVVCTIVWLVALSVGAGASKCPPDSAKVGTVCVDLYEASVWQIPPSNTSLVTKVQAGKATRADLIAGGATHLSLADSCTPPFPKNFPPNGNWTPVSGSNPPSPGVYAVSIPGVLPTGCMSWFQANQACLLSGKRLLTNREWQGAAAGTPDPGITDNGTTDCNVHSTEAPSNTGSRSSCKSSWGVFDMVGNVFEEVADWVDNKDSDCLTDWTSQTGIAGTDESCFGGSGNSAFYRIPGALSRGGSWGSDVSAGVFDVSAFGRLEITGGFFRCAR
jgi:formylglycine-generating enzyme required for sulfatase activity